MKRKAVRGGLALLTLACASPALPQAASPPPACQEPEYRQFDFWVGKWDVYPTGKDNLVAHSLIERLYNGCAIRENWMPLRGTGGGSLSNYDSNSGKWLQAWVDSTGTRVDFEGGYQGDRMVISGFWRGVGGPGKDGLVRMTYSRLPEGAVRQLGEVSTDEGKSWQPSFDFTYRPAA